MNNWPDRLRLLSVLATASCLLENSDQDDWALRTPKEIKKLIDQIIASVYLEGKMGLPENWQSLFAPTGMIQESSLANGWGEVFLKLAEEFDGLQYILNKHEAEQAASSNP